MTGPFARYEGGAPDALPRPAIHLAIPVDDVETARTFYGTVLGLVEGRSTDHWIDWNLAGHQLVTHLVRGRVKPSGTSLVEDHDVPIPHFGLLVDIDTFHDLTHRLNEAGVPFDIEPFRRFPDTPGEQWTMFFRDPAGNAMEFKSFRDESMVFAQ